MERVGIERGGIDGPVSAAGRHTLDEDAVLTPIFHALARSGWRSRQHDAAAPVQAADPLAAFRSDPLTAPIPVQVFSTVLQHRRRGAPVVATDAGPGRHHRRPAPISRH